MTEISNWMYVDAFTVDQAAALWCEIDPSKINFSASLNPPEFAAVKQMLTAAILTGELPADASHNGLQMIGDHSKTIVRRSDLEAYGRKRNLFPRFLFDTLAPFAEVKPAWMRNIATPIPTNQSSVAPNKGGRPPEYDWDRFLLEIIRKANTPDGLPEKQADLIKDMLAWFNNTFGNEPAESAVKSRISKIYQYLAEAKNPTK